MGSLLLVQVLGPFVLEEAANFPETEQVPLDTRQMTLCRDAKEEVNENSTTQRKDLCDVRTWEVMYGRWHDGISF